MQEVRLQDLNKPIPADLLAKVCRFDAIEHNTLVQHGLSNGPLIPVPDSEAKRLQERNLVPKFDVGHNNDVSFPSTKLKRKCDDDDVATELDDAGNNDTRSRLHGARPKRVCVKRSRPLVNNSSSVPVCNKSSLGAGCMWSSSDWSCSYDAVFMILFHAYHTSPLAQ